MMYRMENRLSFSPQLENSDRAGILNTRSIPGPIDCQLGVFKR